MPAPSPLKIATQAVSRLVKEEQLYKKELETQNKRIAKLEEESKSGASADGNAAYMLNQEKKAAEETQAIFEPLRTKISDAVARLEEQVAAADGEGDAEEVSKAREVLASVPKAEAQ